MNEANYNDKNNEQNKDDDSYIIYPPILNKIEVNIHIKQLPYL